MGLDAGFVATVAEEMGYELVEGGYCLQLFPADDPKSKPLGRAVWAAVLDASHRRLTEKSNG